MNAHISTYVNYLLLSFMKIARKCMGVRGIAPRLLILGSSCRLMVR